MSDDNKPTEQPQKPNYVEKTRGNQRRSYTSPSREGKIAVAVHIDPSLKEDLDNAVDRSGLTQQEYLAALIRYAVKGHPKQTDETLHLSEEALEKTREAEKAIRQLTVDLSRRSR